MRHRYWMVLSLLLMLSFLLTMSSCSIFRVGGKGALEVKAFADGVVTESDVGNPDSLVVTWLKNKEADLDGYKVFKWWDSDSVNTVTIDSVGLDTISHHVFGDVADWDTLRFVVTAYDTASNESKPSNMIYWVFVCGGDWDHSGKIDYWDLVEFAKAYGKTEGHPAYNQFFDFSGPEDKPDGKVNHFDLSVFAMERFGKVKYSWLQHVEFK